MKIRLLILMIGTVFCFGIAHSATVKVFDNSMDYSAATGQEIFLIDFNNSPGGSVDGGTISVNANFGSPEANNPNLVIWNSNALSDSGSTLVSTGVGPIIIDFTDPSIRAFSLDFLSAREQETIELYDSSGALFSTVLAPNASGFLGLISKTSIDSLIIRNGISTSGDRDRFFVDNLRTHVIPIPGTIWILGSAVAGIVFLRKRNNKNRNM